MESKSRLDDSSEPQVFTSSDSQGREKAPYVPHSDHQEPRAEKHLSATIEQHLTQTRPTIDHGTSTHLLNQIDLTQDDTGKDSSTLHSASKPFNHYHANKPLPPWKIHPRGNPPTKGLFHPLPIDKKLQAQQNNSHVKTQSYSGRGISSLIATSVAQADTYRPTTTATNTPVQQPITTTSQPAAGPTQPKLNSYTQMKNKLHTQINDLKDELEARKLNTQEQDSIIEEQNARYSAVVKENAELRCQLRNLRLQVQTPERHLSLEFGARIRANQTSMAQKDARIASLNVQVANLQENGRQAEEKNSWLVHENSVALVRLEQEKDEIEANLDILIDISTFSVSEARQIATARDELFERQGVSREERANYLVEIERLEGRNVAVKVTRK